jgi:FkbM family methyltransferase
MGSAGRRALDLVEKGWHYVLSAFERPRDLPFLFRRIVLHRVHHGELIRLNRHRAWLRSAGISTVLDVGAHVGEFASAIRALLPGAQIYSFEPLADLADVLTRRLARFGRFQAFPVALGDQPGTETMWRSSFSESSSLLEMSDLHSRAFPWTSRTTPAPVSIRTLDSFLPELVLQPKVLLKLDVQGYEGRVLRGAAQLLERVDYALVEVSFKPLYAGQASFRDVYELLSGAGFEYSGSLDQMTSPLDGSILQADALFIRRDDR